MVGDKQLYTRPLAVNLIEGTMGQVVTFLDNLPYGPQSARELFTSVAEWREKCFSSMNAMESERSGVQALVAAMPRMLRQQIERMISDNHRQRARKQLSKIPEYSGSLELLRGNIAYQMVRIIDKEMKAASRRRSQACS